MKTRTLSPRQAAKAAGETKYQGAACLKGHRGVRYTCNGHCIDCLYEDVYRRLERGAA